MGTSSEITVRTWWCKKPNTRLLSVLQTPEEGASTAVFLASAPEMEGVTGGYYEDSRRKSPSARAVDSRLAYELWRVSEELTGATEALEPLQLSVLASNVLS